MSGPTNRYFCFQRTRTVHLLRHPHLLRYDDGLKTTTSSLSLTMVDATTATTATNDQKQMNHPDELAVKDEPTESEVPPTNLLYLTWEGNFQLECKATVLRCNILDSSNEPKQTKEQDSDDGIVVQVCLDQTVLHAQGGGQPTDFGTIRILRDDDVDGDMNVTLHINQVLLDRATGIALHTGRLVTTKTETSESSSTISSSWLPNVGDSVHVMVESDRRRILSECHTAGHVVDAAMARCELYLPPSKAYHYLEGPYVEYQGNVNNVNANNTNELLAKLQHAFCQLIEENVETKIDLVSRSQAQAMCHPLVASQMLGTTTEEDNIANAEEHTQPIRIVTVAGWPCPCGGTHVKSTGELAQRKWNITGIKSKKGVVRVKYHYQV